MHCDDGGLVFLIGNVPDFRKRVCDNPKSPVISQGTFLLYCYILLVPLINKRTARKEIYAKIQSKESKKNISKWW